MKLIARIIKRNNVHARVNVWQDGGLAGTLVVDNAVADEVVVALNVATAMPALLTACKEALCIHPRAPRSSKEHWETFERRELIQAAIAKAEGTE